MQNSPSPSSSAMPAAPGTFRQSRQPDELAYQAFTVAAILVLLGSLCGF